MLGGGIKTGGRETQHRGGPRKGLASKREKCLRRKWEIGAEGSPRELKACLATHAVAREKEGH